MIITVVVNIPLTNGKIPFGIVKPTFLIMNMVTTSMNELINANMIPKW